MTPVWFVFLGILSLLLSAVLQSFCEIGRQSRPELRVKVFDSPVRRLFQMGWLVLLLIGGVLLWFVHPVVGLVSIFVYWVLLPLSIDRRIKERMLPPWSVVKGDLEKLGYNEHNYLRGDWWKKEKSGEIQLHLKRKKTQDADTNQDQ